MSCVICTGALTEEPDHLLGGVNSGSGPSANKKRKSSATSGGGGAGPSTSRGGGGGSEEETGVCATSCGHVYHRACIGRWLKDSTFFQCKKCPLCQEKISKKGLKTVYLTGDGLERSERKLKDEVDEKSKQLMESKRGQREMSQRIDELFEENEEAKKKNRGLEEKVRILEEMWDKSKNKGGDDELGKDGGMEKMKREFEIEKRRREMAEKVRGLEEKVREMEVTNRDLKKKNWDLDLKINKLEKEREDQDDMKKLLEEVREYRKEKDEKKMEAERKREFEKKNRSVIDDLTFAKMKCTEVEMKYSWLKGKVAELMLVSGTLNKELQSMRSQMVRWNDWND